MSNDYPLQVQTRSRSKAWGGALRVWALQTAVEDADYVADNMHDGEVVVMDTRNQTVVYSTVHGHSNYIPAE